MLCLKFWSLIKKKKNYHSQFYKLVEYTKGLTHSKNYIYKNQFSFQLISYVTLHSFLSHKSIKYYKSKKHNKKLKKAKFKYSRKL